MPSCRVILKKLMRDKRITVDEYDKLLRNLKPQITKEDAIDYLHQIRWMQIHDKEVWHNGYERGKSECKTGKWIDCGWSIRCSLCDYDMPWAVRNYCPNCGAKMEGSEEE